MPTCPNGMSSSSDGPLRTGQNPITAPRTKKHCSRNATDCFFPRLFLSYYFYHPTPKLLVDIEITNHHVPTHIPLNCCCSRMQHQALNHQLNGFYLIHHQSNINENGLGLGQVLTECRLKLLYGDQDLYRSIQKDL